MIVEICGIDGSGKSTLVDALRRSINNAGTHWAYERVFRFRSKRFLEHIASKDKRRRAEDIFDPTCVELVQAIDLVDEASRHFFFDVATSSLVFFVTEYGTSGIASVLARARSALDPISQVYAQLPSPDVSIFLRIAPSEALRRIEARTKGDQMLQALEPLSTLTASAAYFDEARSILPYRQVVLDATQPAEVLTRRALELIWPALTDRPEEQFLGMGPVQL